MTVLIFIAVLLLLIIGHEFGHFIAAKLSNMRVDEFGVGFPPKIAGKKVGETEYTLNWLPFGGFVRIRGEDGDDANDPRAFSNRPAAAQAAVLFAGPFMNIVMAFLLSSGAFMLGTSAVIEDTNAAFITGESKVVIGAVLPDSPAALAGIKAGDAIRTLSSGFETHTIASAEEVSERITASDGPVTLTLARGDEMLQIEVEPVAGLIEDDPSRPAIGVATALVGTISYPPHIALWKGATDTAYDFAFITGSLAALIGDAFTLSADVSNIAGPVGIATLTGEAARFGLGSLLGFAALLSVNLAIVNMLPFPALDGGRLVFLGVETALRRRVPAGVAQAVNTGGFFVLIILMLAVTVGDISRLLG